MKYSAKRISINRTVIDTLSLSIELFNIHGEQLGTIFKNRNLSIGTPIEEISLKQFPTGTYYLKIQNSKGNRITKVIKN